MKSKTLVKPRPAGKAAVSRAAAIRIDAPLVEMKLAHPAKAARAPSEDSARPHAVEEIVHAVAAQAADRIGKAGVRRRSLALLLKTSAAKEGFVEGAGAQYAADLIRDMRRRRGWTQAQLAKSLDVEPSRIGELEAGTGKLGPTLGKLQQIAAACGFRLVIGFQ